MSNFSCNFWKCQKACCVNVTTSNCELSSHKLLQNYIMSSVLYIFCFWYVLLIFFHFDNVIHNVVVFMWWNIFKRNVQEPVLLHLWPVLRARTTILLVMGLWKYQWLQFECNNFMWHWCKGWVDKTWSSLQTFQPFQQSCGRTTARSDGQGWGQLSDPFIQRLPESGSHLHLCTQQVLGFSPCIKVTMVMQQCWFH